MKSINFKSVYAIPHEKLINPANKDFMLQTAVLKDSTKPSSYDDKSDIYYVYIRDENDKKFENCALKYGILCSRVNQANSGITPAQKEMDFLNTAMLNGLKHIIAQNGDKKEVTLMDISGDKISAKYFIENGKLVKKVEYLDGKEDMIYKFDSNGQLDQSELVGDKFNVLFESDEQGKPKIQIDKTLDLMKDL